MTVLTPHDTAIHIPVWVRDFDTFVTWMHSDEFPDEGRIEFIRGEVLVDLSLEELFSHNQVKCEITSELGHLVRQEEAGFFVAGGMRFTNADAELATNPDGMFVSTETFAAKRVVLRSGAKGHATELRGTPDVVIEIVSESSVDKDTAWLMSAYHDAGIPEYWVIDARPGKPKLDIHRHGAKGYTAARKSAGWAKSATFDRSFRLTRAHVADGLASYALESR